MAALKFRCVRRPKHRIYHEVRRRLGVVFVVLQQVLDAIGQYTKGSEALQLRRLVLRGEGDLLVAEDQVSFERSISEGPS